MVRQNVPPPTLNHPHQSPTGDFEFSQYYREEIEDVGVVRYYNLTRSSCMHHGIWSSTIQQQHQRDCLLLLGALSVMYIAPE